MRSLAALLAVLAGGVATAQAASPPKTMMPVPLPPTGSALAAAVPATAGARQVTLKLTMRYEMQCGWPGAGPLIVSLPAAMHVVPRTITRATVRVDGKPPAAVSATGRVIVFTLPPRRGVTCMEIGPGVLTVVFAPAAGIGNPAKPGTYPIAIRIGAHSFTAHLRV
jgi:hypothetical protein